MKISTLDKQIETNLQEALSLLKKNNQPSTRSNNTLIDPSILNESSICVLSNQPNQEDQGMKNIKNILSLSNQVKETIKATSGASITDKYEDLLRKLETDVRVLIKTQFQLKIYMEALEQKVQDLEGENARLHTRIKDTKSDYEAKLRDITSRFKALEKVIHR